MGTSTTSPLLDALRAGATVEWVPLRLEDGSTIEVMSEPLRAADGVAYSCTPVEAQQCADLLDAVLLTPKIADLMWLVADVRLTPHTQPTGHSSHVCPGCGQHDPGPWELCWRCGSTERTDSEDRERVDKLRKLGPLNRSALVAAWGKPWALSKGCFTVPGFIGQPYGYFVDAGEVVGGHWRGIPVWPSVTGMAHVIQPCSSVHAPHGATQLDFAEPVVLWRSERALELLTGPDHQLISHEGVLAGMRLPGVPHP